MAIRMVWKFSTQIDDVHPWKVYLSRRCACTNQKHTKQKEKRAANSLEHQIATAIARVSAIECNEWWWRGSYEIKYHFPLRFWEKRKCLLPFFTSLEWIESFPFAIQKTKKRRKMKNPIGKCYNMKQKESVSVRQRQWKKGIEWRKMPRKNVLNEKLSNGSHISFSPIIRNML